MPNCIFGLSLRQPCGIIVSVVHSAAGLVALSVIRRLQPLTQRLGSFIRAPPLPSSNPTPRKIDLALLCQQRQSERYTLVATSGLRLARRTA